MTASFSWGMPHHLRTGLRDWFDMTGWFCLQVSAITVGSADVTET